MTIKKCYECEKVLRFLNSFYHPFLGKKVIVCGECFDKIYKSIENYQNFILNDIKTDKTIKIDTQYKTKKNIR